MNKREQIDYILDNLDIGLHEYYNYSLRLDEYWRVHGLDDFAIHIAVIVQHQQERGVFMLQNRMVVAGPLYQDDKTGDFWGEMGATAMTGPLDPGVGKGELDAAQRLGERVAQVTRKMKGLGRQN